MLFQGFSLHENLRAVEISCPWCEADVPLPEGDFSGVCIKCGTVVFRGSHRTMGAEGKAEPDERGQSLPAPAI